MPRGLEPVHVHGMMGRFWAGTEHHHGVFATPQVKEESRDRKSGYQCTEHVGEKHLKGKHSESFSSFEELI